MGKVIIFLFCAFHSLICLSQHRCIYSKSLVVDFSIIDQKIINAGTARFKVTFQNNGKKPIAVYDTLIDGDLYGFDANFWIEIKMQDSDSIWKEVYWKHYGAILPPEGSSFQSQLKNTLLNSGEQRALYFDFFPAYIKYLKVGRYVARLGLRKIPISKKKDCGEYYFSDPIYFDVVNELKQEGYHFKGKIRYVPRKVDVKSGRLLTKDGGYVDKFGNIWQKGPTRTAGQDFEWDVQLSNRGRAMLGHLSRDGKHLNVSLDGKITH